jgi:opacity protein-like surface antigen
MMKLKTTAIAAPLLLLAAQANAQSIEPPVGLFVGGSISQSKFDVDNSSISGIDDKDNGWKAILGYRFNRNLGVEGSFNYMGTAKTPSASVGGDYLAEARAIPAYGVGFLPLGPVDLFGKIGIALVDAQGNVDGAEYDDRGSEFTYGVGVQFRLNRFAIRAEYEKFDTDVIGGLDLMSLGATYTFGSN